MINQISGILSSGASGAGNSAISWAGNPQTPSGAILQIGIETAAVLALSVLAGVSDKSANISIALMAALWILALIVWYGQKG